MKDEGEKKKSKKRRIRPLALGVIRRPVDGKYLVMHGYDSVNGEEFYRPLGGGIDFGEKSQTTIRRELKEEIGAELVNVNLLGFFENVFEHEGKPGHEIIVMYEASFTDLTLYQREKFEFTDGKNEDPVTAVWRSLDDFKELPLYPDGLLKMLKTMDKTKL